MNTSSKLLPYACVKCKVTYYFQHHFIFELSKYLNKITGKKKKEILTIEIVRILHKEQSVSMWLEKRGWIRSREVARAN